MLTIDDLGRAAWDAEFKAFLGDRISPPNWDHLTEGDRRPTIFAALAAVERFAEEAIKNMDWYSDVLTIRELVASLRDEVKS